MPRRIPLEARNESEKMAPNDDISGSWITVDVISHDHEAEDDDNGSIVEISRCMQKASHLLKRCRAEYP